MLEIPTHSLWVLQPLKLFNVAVIKLTFYQRSHFLKKIFIFEISNSSTK